MMWVAFGLCPIPVLAGGGWTGETSCSRPKMGVATLVRRKLCVKDLFPKAKVWFWNPQVEMLAPFAPMSFGQSDATEEEQGKMLSMALESKRNSNLLCLSFKNNNPEPCEKDIAVAVSI
jgi:hypothetical protein